MLTRFFGGVTAVMGAAGMLAAQQPSPAPSFYAQAEAYRGAAVPVRTVWNQPAANPAAPMVARGQAPTAPQLVPRTAAIVTPTRFVAGQAPAAAAPQGTLPAAPGATPAPAATETVPHTTASRLLTSVPSYANCADDGYACGDASCGPGGRCCTPCGPLGKFWVDAGYVYWQTSGQYILPVVTTAPLGTPVNQAGTLGNPSTSVLYGGRQYNDNYRSGFYLRAGMWCDECQTRGFEGNFFYLGGNRQNASFTCDANGSPIVMRPFTNAARGFTPDTEIVCYPDILRGTVSVSSNTNVIGGGGNYLRNLCCGPCGRLDLLLGYQYLNVTDEVIIREDLTSLDARRAPVGTRFQIEDKFRTSNNFHGANIGIAMERRFGRAYLGFRATTAFGVNYQTYDISGSTVITPPAPGVAQSFAGGLLTQPSNIGHYSRSQFAVMPSVGLKLGYQVTDNLRAYVGYDYTYLSNIARAGDQIDLRVNSNQIPRLNGTQAPNGNFPRFEPKTTNFSMSGIRAGIELRF